MSTSTASQECQSLSYYPGSSASFQMNLHILLSLCQAEMLLRLKERNKLLGRVAGELVLKEVEGDGMKIKVLIVFGGPTMYI